MITITYKGPKEHIQQAVTAANALLRNDNFYRQIISKGSFDPQYTSADATPTVIADLIRTATLEMTVLLYLGPLRVYAYDDTYNYNLIHLNRLYINRNIPSLVNTMIHEMVHAVNYLNPQYRFDHGDNSPVGKENTAPYWIGNKAEEMLSGTAPADLAWLHDTQPEDAALS